MSDINKIAVRITGDESGLKKATKAAQKDIKSIGASALSIGDIIKGSAVGSAIGTMISNMAGAISGAISSELDSAFKRFDALNNYSKVMGNLRIGTEDSSQSIAILDQKLRGLPTSLSDAALGVQRFTAANGNIQASTDMFLAFNNAILAGGAATETQATAMEQLIQAYSKGKADAQEWRAMLIAMPAQMKQIAEAMGYTSTAIGGDFQTALNNGTISMNDFAMTAIRLNRQGAGGFASFAEQAKGATGGVQTAITNMKIAIQRGLADIMSAIGQANIAGFFSGIANAIGKVTQFIAAFISIIKQAIAWLAALFGWGGSGSTDSIVQTTGATETNLGGAAENAAGTADGLNDAAGAAKKLQKQLAGFDEMNVLQDKEPAGGSGGGGGGAGGGGAGGSAAIADYKWDTSGLDNAKNKIEELANKIKDWFKKAFGEWDFDKIGKSIQKFAKQVQKFIEPIGKILSDIWTNYLRPFITWTGNELLPAFLNAVGGALEFLGALIAKLWSTALKPFIDLFLVPLAQFTGGVIVGVLNAIGDALSWIAKQDHIIDLISGIAVAITTVKAATIAWTAAKSVAIGVMTTANMMTGSLTTSMSALAFQTGAATGNFGLMAAGVGTATTAVGGFKTVAAGIGNTIFSPMSIAILGVVAAYEALQVAQEAAKLKDMEAAAAAAEYDAKIFDETETMYALNDAVQAQIDLKNELLGIDKSLADAEIALLNAQDAVNESTTTAEAVATKYGLTLDEARAKVDEMDIASGNLTAEERELADAVLDLESKEGTLRDATDKVTEAKDSQTQASQELANQANKEWAMAKKQELQTLVNEGRYRDLAQALVDMSEEEVTYTDENGKMCKVSQENVKSMTDYVGRLMGQMGTDNSETWKQIYYAAGASTDGIKNKLHELSSSAEQDGRNITSGVSRGIQGGQGGVFSVIGSFAAGISSVFKSKLGIASPSKVFAKFGNWIDEGLAGGIEDNADKAVSATTALGTAMVDAFNSAPKFQDLGGIDLADKFGELTAKAQGTLELQNESTNDAIDQLAEAIGKLADKDQRVVVKIGEETLIDKIVDGLNNASRMRNQTVLNL